MGAYPLTPEGKPSFKEHFLGKKSILAKLFQEMITLPAADRKEVGSILNTLKKEAESRYQQLRESTLSDSHNFPTLQEATLSPPYLSLGSLHPLTIVRERIIAILEEVGFALAEGPEIETAWHNFTALNFPPHHPAREMQDTFFIKRSKADKQSMLLRTHTSSVQIRVMKKTTPPIQIISAGKVYRQETVSARSHYMFHQIEALHVDSDLSFLDLRKLINYFFKVLFGTEVQIRLRPSYFPFTEPSAEVDLSCWLCQQQGCPICKKSGWVEVGGAGMVDPQVLENCNIDSHQYRGYAFGMGIERIAMLLSQIPDVRLFTQNDLRFLRQFKRCIV